MMSKTRIYLLFALFALFALYYLIPLESRAFWQPDETRYAEISREMLQSGNWITPHFLGLRYFEKPIAGYWVNNLGQMIFGHNRVGARIGVVFSTLMSALMLFWLSIRFFNNQRLALTASLIFLTSLLVYGTGTYAVLDPMLSMWLTAVMCLYWYSTEASEIRQRCARYLMMGAACGMGFMTKGFLAFAIPVLTLVPFALYTRRFRELLLYGPLAVLSAAVLCAPWALAIHHQEPDFWNYFFWIEHVQRFAGDNAQHKAPFWYYLPVLLAGSLPWLALLPGAIRLGWKQRHDHEGGVYLLTWVFIPVLFFSFAQGKLLTYILPCFAPLTLLIAWYGCQQESRGEKGLALTLNGWVNIFFGLVGIAVLFFRLTPSGMSEYPLYAENEKVKVFLAFLSFAGWIMFGVLSLGKQSCRWRISALCPLVLALSIGTALPERIQHSKQPQVFLQSISGWLRNSDYILSDNPGISSAIAWITKRSDILAFDDKGELQYGLSYPDAAQRYVSIHDFGPWLRDKRQRGSVLLVIRLAADDEIPDTLPRATRSLRNDRMLALFYEAEPAR